MAKSKPRFKRVAQLKSPQDFRGHLKELGIELPFNDRLWTASESPLGQPYALPDEQLIGNRFCILPMEGWDGTLDGLPSDLTRRRWMNFGISGAKLLWGGEAVAVRHDGRANPNQLLMNQNNLTAFKQLLEDLLRIHEDNFGTSSDLLVGLQLTHSGRFSRPDQGRGLQSKILYRHSLLDKKLGLPDDYPLMTDAEIDHLVEDFVAAAQLAHQAGFHFVDIKHCHGYLGHEFLSSFSRPGKYGGELENRTRFLQSVVQGIRQTSNLPVGVRLSCFDWMPYKGGIDGVGIPEGSTNVYREAFGGDGTGTGIDLTETFDFLSALEDMGINLVCLTAGSPYYVPHIQRPALFPPSDGYLPPEDPLVGVARQIAITGQIKKRFPNMAIVGSAYSYLQEWLPHVGEAVVEQGLADFVGLGRMVLSYPELPSDVLAGRTLQRGRICRTFSDCTTAPRNGMVSGCFPLDPFYKERPEAERLDKIKRDLGT